MPFPSSRHLPHACPTDLASGPRPAGEQRPRRLARRAAQRLIAPWLAVAACWLPCASAAAPAAEPPHPRSTTAYALETLALRLPLPVDAVPLDDTGDLLIVSLDGAVWRYADGAVTLFLALGGRVTGLLGEQGLFTAALEPAARAAARGNARHIVVAFTEARTNDLVVAAYPLTADASGADAAQETVLLRVPMREAFHHGGQVVFGADDMLYVSVGEGQREVEYLHETPPPAQDLTSLLGKVLRIDPFPADGAAPYTVPSDNPFAGGQGPAAQGARGEVYALGFRNPWKFSFASSDGALLLADVGEDTWEEIDVVRAGANYGWPYMEGPHCFEYPDTGGLVAPDCENLPLVGPAAYYAHLRLDPAGGLAVTGGFEAHDPALPELVGKYLFGDFVSGRLWSLDRATGAVELLLETGLPISAIVPGAAGEVLVLGIEGTLARLVMAH
mgnify:CR=1 FL=1